jgi:uracil phosphoribosyltransferase
LSSNKKIPNFTGMILHHISQENSILNQFLIEIRDKTIQQDRWRFRQNLERIGEVLAYEMSKSLTYKTKEIETVLGQHQKAVITEDLVFCSILRAGLPLHQGIARFFDHQDHAFISAYRTHDKSSDTFNIHIEYCATPDLNGRTLVLVDPMLATGHSLIEVYKALGKKFNLKKIHILSAIGAQPGVDYLEKHCPANTELWVADIDQNLNEKGYIVPGLGDAGDLAFGSKL